MSASEIGISLDSLSFRPKSGTYLARYDATETPASLAVVATLAAALDVDPTEMDQLYHSVDCEALDELLVGRVGADTDVRIEFTFEGHAVAVTDTEVVAARESGADRDRLDTGGSASA